MVVVMILMIAVRLLWWLLLRANGRRTSRIMVMAVVTMPIGGGDRRGGHRRWFIVRTRGGRTVIHIGRRNARAVYAKTIRRDNGDDGKRTEIGPVIAEIVEPTTTATTIVLRVRIAQSH